MVLYKRIQNAKVMLAISHSQTHKIIGSVYLAFAIGDVKLFKCIFLNARK